MVGGIALAFLPLSGDLSRIKNFKLKNTLAESKEHGAGFYPRPALPIPRMFITLGKPNE